MNFKTTLVLLVLLLTIGAFYFFFEQHQPATPEAERQAKLLLPRFQPGEVHRIAIARPRDPTATAVVVERAGPKETWHIQAPVKGEADQGEADGILSTLEYLEKKRSLSDVKPAAAGLEPPRLKVDLGKGEAARTILVGDEDLTGKQVYVRVEGQDEVHLVPSYVFGRLDRQASDLRDKTVFSVDRWQVGRIALGGRDVPAPLELKKDGEAWHLERPEADYADRQRAEDLLAAAHDARAKTFVTDAADPEALKRHGLAPPRIAVTLAAGEKRETLEVGDAVPGAKDEHYARRADKQTIVTVDGTKLRDLATAPLESWRWRRLLPPARDPVEVLDVRKAGAAKALARLERKDGAWRFVEPRTATADVAAVDELLRAIQELELVDVPAKKVSDPANFGLGERALVVTLETPKEKRGFRLGKPTTRTDGYYAQREGGEAAYEVMFPKASVLRSAWPALRERRLLSATPNEVVRIDVTRTGKPLRPYVRKPDGTWATPEATADAAELDRLAEDLAMLTAESIIVAPDDLASIGLKDPWLRASIELEHEEPPATLELGKVVPEGGAFHARLTRAGDVTYFVLKKDLVDQLDSPHFTLGAPPAPLAPPAPPAPPAPAPEMPK